ncbi:hypothetical protein LD112_14500 [Pantoea agglomerans]|nr:hypothetical protein [Pantoea agglomerans]
MRCATSFIPLLVISCCAGWAQQATADTVWLNNGDRLTGTIRYLSDGKLAIETHYAGTVTLDWSAVSTLASENPVNVENKKDRRTLSGAALLIRSRLCLGGTQRAGAAGFAAAH